jgi:hypothetical protein
MTVGSTGQMLMVGDTVALTSDALMLTGGRFAVTTIDGEQCPVERVSSAEGATFFADRYGTVTPRVEDVEAWIDNEEETGEDVRTLWVDTDEQHERYKEWRKVCMESSSTSFRDSPLEGPPCMLTLAKSWMRNGGTPEMFLQLWGKEKGFAATDRVMREMKTLIMAIHYAGTYDQVNIGSLVCLEVLARRCQGIIDAHSVSSSTPNWKLAGFYEGGPGGVDTVADDLKRFAVRRARERDDLNAASSGGNYRGRNWEADGNGAEPGAAGPKTTSGKGDQAAGGIATPKAKPKGGGRGRTRGVVAAPAQ